MQRWQSGAVPFYTGGGAQMVPVGGEHGKICPVLLEAALERVAAAAYEAMPAVLSVTQPTEAGTLYSAQELARLSTLAHHHGMTVRQRPSPLHLASELLAS